MRGIGGRLLEVDLTNGKVKDLPVSDGMFEKYLGGRGVGARLLFDRLPAKTDPLSPENFLIFLTGPLTGNLAPGSSKFVVVTKSPLTQGWCDTYSSGRMAVELKRIGYDGIIVTGKANHPCYLKIDDEGVRIKEADFIWGKDSFETERLLKEREKCESLRVVSIGPAGERLCKYASINSDLYRQAGRGGAGAVMGSKNLKAVAVRGTGGIKTHDRPGIVELNREFYRRAQKSEVARTRRKYGTPLTLNITNAGGILPTKNFQFGTWQKAIGTIDAEAVNRSTISHRACLYCFTPCSLITRISTGEFTGTILEGPEYETLGMFGSNLLIDSLPVVCQANVLCDKLGLDTISTGNVIGFIMECFERALIDPSQTEGYTIRFGDGHKTLETIEKIAYREGYGQVMGEGVKELSRRIGQGSERFAMHVKGMEYPAYEPRGAFGAALSYAVSPRGACHRRAWPPAKEILGPYPPYTVEGKAEMIKGLYDENCILHSLLVCDIPAKFVPITLDDYSRYWEAVTGNAISGKDFLFIADRIETLIRIFNVREGFDRRDDALPGRTLTDPLPDGPAKGQIVGEENFNRMLDEYYSLRGWDSSGTPTSETVRKYEL